MTIRNQQKETEIDHRSTLRSKNKKLLRDRTCIAVPVGNDVVVDVVVVSNNIADAGAVVHSLSVDVGADEDDEDEDDEDEEGLSIAIWFCWKISKAAFLFFNFETSVDATFRK